MSTHLPIRFGLVGAGGISAAWSQALLDAPDLARLVAVADAIPERADELAAKHPSARSHDCAGQMVSAGGLDAVILCTPPRYHAEQTCQMVEAGLHVLCEKPLALEVRDAIRMAEAATKAGVCFTMASKFRFVADIVQAREMVRQGAIGDIVLFENQFTSVIDMSQRWNSRPEISGGGVLIDNGTHSLDLMRYFLGPVEQVQVVEGRRIQNLPVEDTVHVFARNRDGVIGSIDLSWSLHKGSPWFVNLHGSRGGIQIGWKQSSCRRNGEADWSVYGRGYDRSAAFRGQLTNFVRAIRGEEPLVITPDEGVDSVKAVEAAYDAMNRSPWVRVSGGGM